MQHESNEIALQDDPGAPSSSQLYLNLMKRVLTGMIHRDPNADPWHEPEFNLELREQGSDWPRDAHTMIGMKRLANIEACAENIIRENIPGDFIETGVWRGGAAIFMRAILKVYQITDRLVWVADSFKGLPTPSSEKYPQDIDDHHHTIDFLVVSIEEVKANFESYGLLDKQVQFLKGWFKDTLPTAPIEKLSLLRIDGDMYESTWDALVNLYPKLSLGGYVIVDDYGALKGCRQAVEDFRRSRNIKEEMRNIDWTGVYWQRRFP